MLHYTVTSLPVRVSGPRFRLTLLAVCCYFVQTQDALDVMGDHNATDRASPALALEALREFRVNFLYMGSFDRFKKSWHRC